MGIGINEDGTGYVTVKKSELLATLQCNRAMHINAYETAMRGYTVALVAALSVKLQDAQEGKRINHHIALTEPTSNEKDYNRIIRMLEMSIFDETKISEDDFDKYVMDNWGWKQKFTATNSLYVG